MKAHALNILSIYFVASITLKLETYNLTGGF